MFGTPADIINASLIILATGKKITLELKDRSYCYVIPADQRIQFGFYKMQLRLDWPGHTGDNDPILDIDLFDNTGKQVCRNKRAKILGRQHHVARSLSPAKKLYTYHFSKTHFDIEFLAEITRQNSQPSVGRIVNNKYQT